MKLAISLAVALATAGAAHAQIVTATSASSTHRIELSDGSSLPLTEFGVIGCTGMAADDANSTLYIASGAPTDRLYRWTYGDNAGPQHVGILAPAGASGTAGQVDGLAFGGGRLYAMVSQAFSVGTPGIFEVDLQTAELTPVFPTFVGPFKGLSFHEASGVFYAPNAGIDELCVIDPAFFTITPISGSQYGSLPVDFEGCALAGNQLYLVGDGVGEPGYVFDLSTNTYSLATFPNPVETNGVGAGCAYAPGIDTTPIQNYCMANANSTGASAAMSSSGSIDVSANDFVLEASSLPAFSFAFFIVGTSQGFVANPGGSDGNLCLVGAIGRYVGPGQIQQSAQAGTIALPIDLTNVPQPNGFVQVVAGETWNFQAWYRDMGGSGATSNFTDGLSVRFQ